MTPRIPHHIEPASAPGEGQWNDVRKPQEVCILPREPLILALREAIRHRSLQELTTVGSEGESRMLKSYRHLLWLIESCGEQEPVVVR